MKDFCKTNKKTNYIAFLGSIIIIATALVSFRSTVKKTLISLTKKSDKPEHWITIFMHGSFGSILALLDAQNVLKDNMSGTKYKKMISKMRKNPYFYQDQPMLQKGLVKVIPSFDLNTSADKTYAVYPITKAYETILNQVSPGKEKNHFYTFGWSGLMSQQRRRLEAIRFYNTLVQELETYKKNGITPKIRIITHSHGGNLALNFGAIKTVVSHLDTPETLTLHTQSTDKQESLQEMLSIMQQLPTKQQHTIKKGQKKFDYIPEKDDLVVHELILFGTPIQPETHDFAFNTIFKKVYNFYSDEDLVQDLDWVSTKKSSSEKNSIFQVSRKKIKTTRRLSLSLLKTSPFPRRQILRM